MRFLYGDSNPICVMYDGIIYPHDKALDFRLLHFQTSRYRVYMNCALQLADRALSCEGLSFRTLDYGFSLRSMGNVLKPN
jgi:hypothetical protein